MHVEAAIRSSQNVECGRHVLARKFIWVMERSRCPSWPTQYLGVNICDSWQQDKPGVASDVHDSEVLAVSLLSSVQRSSHTYEHNLVSECIWGRIWKSLTFLNLLGHP